MADQTNCVGFWQNRKTTFNLRLPSLPRGCVMMNPRKFQKLMEQAKTRMKQLLTHFGQKWTNYGNHRIKTYTIMH
jgi:hypothetical protein